MHGPKTSPTYTPANFIVGHVRHFPPPRINQLGATEVSLGGRNHISPADRPLFLLLKILFTCALTKYEAWRMDDYSDGDGEPSIRDIDLAIRSNDFWPYVGNVNLCGFQAEWIGRWGEAM